jgi:hypothetical protein
MSPEIQSRVIERLFATDKSDAPWARIALVAIEGAAQLDVFLDKKINHYPIARTLWWRL